MSDTVVLIDMGSLAHPLWHVSQSDPNPDTTSIKIVERVRALASGQPHVAVCYDTGRSFRHDIDPTYKSQRPEHLATLQYQIDLALDTLRADGFPCYGVKDYEADDVIASIAARVLARDLGTSVVVVSSDKDLCALIGGGVVVRSLTNGAVYDAEGVKAKFGVAPEQIVDYLALVGDTSDGVKGARGIGAKTAAALLQKYGTLEDLYTQLTEHGTQFTPAMATALREFQPRLPTVRALLTLHADVPLDIDAIWKPRVPADADAFVDDIDFAMPTLGASEMESSQPDTRGATNGQAPVTSRAAPVRVKCDGNHAMPRCDDPECWQDNPVILASGLPGPRLSRAASEAAAASQNSSGRDPILVPQMAIPSPGPVGLAPVPYERQLEPTSLRECAALASEMFKSRLFSAYGTPQGVLSTLLAGRELGLSAMSSLRSFHIIDGKPSLSADLIRALVLRSGMAESFRCTARSAESVTFTTKRKGDPEFSLTYTLDEAKAAWSKDERAWKASGWGRHPADMLVARCSAKLARLVYADVVTGLYSPEELE
jgi:DNA polymerase-1